MTDREELIQILVSACGLETKRGYGQPIASEVADEILASDWFKNLTVGRVSQKPLR